MSRFKIPRDDFIRMMFGIRYPDEVARQMAIVQPMPGKAFEPLYKFLADGGAIKMSCDSFVVKPKPQREEEP